MKVKGKVFFNLIVVCLIAVCLSGCTALRKKFTRKRKTPKKEKFIPVLEPIKYNLAQKTAEERYRYHYFLWRGWCKELEDSVAIQTWDKRQRKFLEQMSLQMGAMQKYVREEKYDVFSDAIKQLKGFQAYFDKPLMLRDKHSFKRKIQRHLKTVTNCCSPDAMAGCYGNIDEIDSSD